MSDYRVATPTTDTESSETPSFENKTTEITQTPTTVEPPYTEYQNKKGKPYPVDYFEIGRYWDTNELYSKEVESIDTYVQHLIHTGEINNTTEAVSKKLKSIEKMINSDPNDRTAARVEKMAAYVEFLIKSDDIKKKAAKYGYV